VKVTGEGPSTELELGAADPPVLVIAPGEESRKLVFRRKGLLELNPESVAGMVKGCGRKDRCALNVKSAATFEPLPKG
jgi:hypothetical protein